MDIGSLLFLLALLILIGLYLSRPLLERTATVVSQAEHELSALLAEKERIIHALEELDFDNTLGKIPEAEYPQQRALLLRQGAEILRRLDQYAPSQPKETLEERLEAAIAARRATVRAAVGGEAPTNSSLADSGSGKESPSPTSKEWRAAAANSDDELEALVAARRRQRLGKAAGFCPHCGKAIQKDDLFCPGCGHSLK
jgi:hypothetical protein